MVNCFNVRLELIWGDKVEALEQLEQQIHAPERGVCQGAVRCERCPAEQVRREVIVVLELSLAASDARSSGLLEALQRDLTGNHEAVELVENRVLLVRERPLARLVDKVEHG